MNAPSKKRNPTLEDATDEEILIEVEDRGIGPAEKDLDEFSDNEIKAEYEQRFEIYSCITAEEVWDEVYRSKIDAPQILRDYLYEKTGKTLP